VVTPSATPSATSTLAVTKTPTPNPTATSGTAPHLPPPAARVAVQCQRSLATNVRRLFRAELANLGACVEGLFKCAQVKGGTEDCIAAATTKCGNRLETIGDEQARFIQNSTKQCAGLALEHILSAAGLDFTALDLECTLEFGIPLADRPAIALCIAAKSIDEAARLLTIAQPRAGELTDIADLTLPPAIELPNFGGTGAGLASLDSARAAVRCQSAIQRETVQLATTQLQDVFRCVDRALTCVQREPGDDDCVAKAAAVCTGASTIATAGPLRECRDKGLPFSELRAPNGANLEALAAECLAVDVAALDNVADYELCLARRARCAVEDVARFAAPRADELLRLIIDTPLQSAVCAPGVLLTRNAAP
jgi:hypothetical protein